MSICSINFMGRVSHITSLRVFIMMMGNRWDISSGFSMSIAWEDRSKCVLHLQSSVEWTCHCSVLHLLREVLMDWGRLSNWWIKCLIASVFILFLKTLDSSMNRSWHSNTFLLFLLLNGSFYSLCRYWMSWIIRFSSLILTALIAWPCIFSFIITIIPRVDLF